MAGERVCVVVLGDLGRSPRMEYHSSSLLNSGYVVDIIAYGGTHPIKRLLENDVNVHLLKEVPACFAKNLPRILAYGAKLIWQCITLLWSLFSIHRPDHILVQAPPSVPALGVVWFYSLCYGANFIVDWHNYGYTILQLSVGKQNFTVQFYKWFEFYFGRKARKHLCVTKALADDLQEKAGIVATPLYDRPPEQFRSYSLEVIHDLFHKLSSSYECFYDKCDTKTAFTETTSEQTISLREDRPALIVSSTSWTEDEDIGVLFAALEAYDQIKNAHPERYPDIVCAITGKGPLKKFHVENIAVQNFRHVKFCFPWLTAEDYPVLLASADVGISLHASSSGLDLPMKVVDMFGCGLPVLALNFKCLNELVQHKQDGYVFKDACTLASQLQELLESFPKKHELNRMKENLKTFQTTRWEGNWNKHAKPLFSTCTYPN